jgi:hypothetical protein
MLELESRWWRLVVERNTARKINGLSAKEVLEGIFFKTRRSARKVMRRHFAISGTVRLFSPFADRKVRMWDSGNGG